MSDTAFPVHASHSVDIMAPPATPHPIGTLSELLQIGINPQRYGCCAPPDPSPHAPVLGCPHAKTCDRKFKFKSGPHNGAVLTVSRAGGRDILEMPCYHYMSRLRDMRLSGNGFEWIADEGEEYMAKTSKEELVSMTHKGPKMRVKLFRERRKVQPFPRPKDNPLLENEIANMEVANFVGEREENRRRTSTLGMSNPREALMKPDEYDKETSMEVVAAGPDEDSKVTTKAALKKAAKKAPPKGKMLTVGNVRKPNAKTDKEIAATPTSDLPADGVRTT